MKNLVAIAMSKLGPLSGERKYCLKILGTLGGQYEESNFATIALSELIRASGHLAHEVYDLPDGMQVRLQIAHQGNVHYRPQAVYQKNYKVLHAQARCWYRGIIKY